MTEEVLYVCKPLREPWDGGTRQPYIPAPGLRKQRSWQGATFTEHLQWVRLFHSEELIFSHVILTLTLPGKQALQAVSANSRGTIHKDHHVSGTPGPAGKHSILQIRKLRLRETK